MEWIVIVSCISSHTWFGMLYCSASKDLEPSYGQASKADCEQWARSYLSEKYYLHNGEFEWGFRCEERRKLTPYEPKEITR